jgi:NADH-quinone oxidoreductase subunit H
MAFFIFFVAALAEMNRPPFDIPVGESEVVGGPFIEYSGIRWSMFFLGEYASLFILSVIGASVFLGGWAWPLGEDLGRWWQLLLVSAKAGFLIFLVIWVRASVPRMRIDQLMAYSWKVLLPLTFAQILVNGAVLVYDGPKVLLLVTGVLGLGTLFWVTERSVRRPRPRPAALIPQSEAAS